MILTTSDPARVVLSREDALESPGFGLCFRAEAAWLSLAAPSPPARASLDPVRFGAELLPHLVILDILHGADSDGKNDYRWRLFGSRHQAELGRDLTGVCLSQLRPEWPGVAELHILFDTAAASPDPTFFRLDYKTHAETARSTHGVMLPLLGTGTEVAHLLGCSEWV